MPRPHGFLGLIFSFLAACCVVLIPQSSLALDNDTQTIRTARFTLHFNREGEDKGPFVNDLAVHSLEILNDTYEELSRIFAAKPSRQLVLRFLPPSEFTRVTGAPAWTAAMFFRGEVSIPLNKNTKMNFEELRRTLRHEYTHAVIAELSNYRCPAWLDEGIAQLIEGKANPLLGPALRRWINHNEAMPLDWLENGFTTLNQELVAAAYAESLFAARSVVNTMGFSAVVRYLTLLGEGKDERLAFMLAFGQRKSDFEEKLTTRINLWAKSEQVDP